MSQVGSNEVDLELAAAAAAAAAVVVVVAAAVAVVAAVVVVVRSLQKHPLSQYVFFYAFVCCNMS